MKAQVRLLEVITQLRSFLLDGRCLSKVESVKLAIEFVQIAEQYLAAGKKANPSPPEVTQAEESVFVDILVSFKTVSSSSVDVSDWGSKGHHEKLQMLETVLVEVGILSNPPSIGARLRE
ncbi:hypothetical protein PgNI_10866 [Pyricularia grisea]|uniref:Uncharacterized protein n=1 Tax=Pyricularia grisea TaxID=148305 RepID=A0A6P8AZW8_PYRGI|nr:hypothetical protein PgNI_10866 [Pyricularia grisea]TLD07880.1 hypothetical protein PgNI_10866 [Pyricularia grisea]